MKIPVCLILLLTLSSGCTQPAARQWLDSGTAVTITAHDEPVVFAREDFPSGVNVRDYAEMGLFDVNRSGEHRRYLLLVLWSTADRSSGQLAAQDEAFANITLWLDDQPIPLARVAIDARAVQISAPVFRLPSPNARTAYYLLDRAQLKALSAARQMSLTPGGAQGDRPYTLWRGSLSSLQAFTTQLR